MSYLLRHTRRALLTRGGSGSAAAPAVLGFVEDTFAGVDDTNLVDHTGEVGATWTHHASYGAGPVFHQIHTGGLKCNNALSECDYASGAPATAEYDVTALIHCVDMTVGIGTGLIGICGRVDVAANTMYIARYDEQNGRWQLLKIEAGAGTSLGLFAQELTDGVVYTLKLEIRDAAKKLYVDGVERISSADNAIAAAGKVGVRGSNYSQATFLIQSISATDA